MADIGRTIAGVRGYGRRGGYEDSRSRNIAMTLAALGGVSNMSANVMGSIQNIRRSAQVQEDRDKTENRLKAADTMSRHLGSLGKEYIDADPFAVVMKAFRDNPDALNQHGLVAEGVQTTRQWQKLQKENILFENSRAMHGLEEEKRKLGLASSNLEYERATKRIQIEEMLSDHQAGMTGEERDADLATVAEVLKKQGGADLEDYGHMIDETIREKVKSRADVALRIAQKRESDFNATQIPTADSVKARQGEVAAMSPGDPDKQKKANITNEQGLQVYTQQANMTQKALSVYTDPAQYAKAYREQVSKVLTPEQRQTKYGSAILNAMQNGVLQTDVGKWTGEDIMKLMQSNPIAYGGFIDVLNHKGEFDASTLSASMREYTVWDAGTAAIAWMMENGYEKNQAAEKVKEMLRPFMELDNEKRFKGSDVDPSMGIDITKKVREEAALSRMLAAASETRGRSELEKILKTTLQGDIMIQGGHQPSVQPFGAGMIDPGGPANLMARGNTPRARSFPMNQAREAREYSLKTRGEDISRELTEYFLAHMDAKTKEEKKTSKKKLDDALKAAGSLGAGER